PARDQIQLNEETVWAGEPGNNVPKNVYSQIQEVRDLLFEGKNKEAQALADATFPRNAPKDLNYGMPYQTVGNLFLNFEGHEKVENYSRNLDIQRAVGEVKYDLNGVHFSRKYFVSYPDQVMIVHLTASKPGSISFNLNMDSPQKQHQISAENGVLQLSGTGGDFENKTGKLRFETLIYPKLNSGELITRDNTLQVKNANEVLLFVSIGTNFKNY